MLSTMKEAEIYRNTKRSLIKFSDKCKIIAVSGLLTRSFMLKHAPLSTATSGGHKTGNFLVQNQGQFEPSAQKLTAMQGKASAIRPEINQS